MKARLLFGVMLLSVLGIFGACAPSQPPSPALSPRLYSEPELRYLLIAQYPDIFYVDLDFYPVAREGQEEANAQQQFDSIRADINKFSAILEHLGFLVKAEYSNDEKLAIYQEHKKLARAIELTLAGDVYNFILRRGEEQGERIEGRITKSGKITVLKREPSFNTVPICLTKGTLIDTPDGQVPVEEMKPGMSVWTADGSGKRVEAIVEKTTATPVPNGFVVVKVTLSDGRSVTASPGHPSVDERALGKYQLGETLDGAAVIAVDFLLYNGGATYDILPSGSTGLYWANGIPLLSTIKGY